MRPGDTRKIVADKVASDARVLYRTLRAVEGIAAELGLELRGTIGGTAWATAKEQLNLPNADHPSAEWRAIREAYFGGRVAVVRPSARGPGSHWDLSSAYPAALATTPVPIGAPRTLAGRNARKALEGNRPGVFACTVTVPDLFMPPLPVREHERVIYPVGTFRGSWTALELRSALARGVTIDECSSALVWESEAVLFEDLIEKWWRARARAGKQSALGQLLRLLMNSLPGKFAESSERRAARMFPDEVVICEGKRPCRGMPNPRCTGTCGAMTQLDMWGQIWTVPIYRPAACGHIAWAATMTAAARERWLHGAESQGTDLVYGDTDSIWTIGRRAPYPSGAGLGRWEYKHAWSDWTCAAPRQYRYTAQDGQVELRTAGAKVTDEEWQRGAAQLDRGVLSFVEAAQASRGLFRRRGQVWTLPDRGRATGRYGDRILDAETGVTVPMRYGQKEAESEGAA